ncbi:MAG: hypothetical protein V1494_05085, partial [Candidatus Diapherotrites archaeon]
GNFLLKKRYENIKVYLTSARDEMLSILILLAALMAFAFFEPPILSVLLFGFYSGFFLFKGLGFDSKKLKGKELIAKEAIGFAVIFLLLAPYAFGFPGEPLFFAGMFFIAGFWISFILPYFTKY